MFGLKNVFAFFAALFGAAAVAKAAESDTGMVAGSSKTIPNGYDGVRAVARKLAGVLGLDDYETEQLTGLFLVQAHSESRGNIGAANETPSESAAAKRLYESRGNDEKLRKSVGLFSPKSWYFPGSAGWFGLMPPTLVNVTGRKSAKGIGLGPKSNQDPWASAVMYAAYLDELIDRGDWTRSDQDMGVLKIGGAAGSLMDNPSHPRSQKALENLDRALGELGLPLSFADQKLDPDIFTDRDWLAVYKAGL